MVPWLLRLKKANKVIFGGGSELVAFTFISCHGCFTLIVTADNELFREAV